jgi:hypothetical protein
MLCYFSHQFPPFVANFLQRGRVLRRRFREESITDLLMGSLVALGGGRLVVEFPDEPKTGADMEWKPPVFLIIGGLPSFPPAGRMTTNEGRIAAGRGIVSRVDLLEAGSLRRLTSTEIP